MRRWNLDHQPVVIENDEPAVLPGESYDFTKEQEEAGLAGTWSDADPRSGLEQELAFKRRRDGTETVADLRQIAADAGLELPPKATKAQIQKLLAEEGDDADEPEGSTPTEPATPDETEPAQPEKE